MRVTIFMGLSLDGFVARKNDGLDFLGDPPDGDSAPPDTGFTAFLASVDVLVMGRRTFEVVQRFGPDKWPYGDKPVIVLSRTLAPPPPGATLPGVPGTVSVANEPAVDLIARLGREGVKHIYIDGAVTAREWLAAGHVTDVVITHVPVLIGEGISVWGPLPHDIRLELVSATAIPGGAVQNRYRVR